MNSPEIDLTFAHAWEAEILLARPLILPPRHFVYPHDVEEVERGAMETMVRPNQKEPFLATCALGFRDEAVTSGVWSMPEPRSICCVSGGYAYVIDTAAPGQFTFVDVRPVLKVLALADTGLLLLVGHRTMEAWGREGLQWESGKLSDEGVEIIGVDGWTLYGMSWDLMSDRERAFVLDLRSGQRLD